MLDLILIILRNLFLFYLAYLVHLHILIVAREKVFGVKILTNRAFRL